MDIPELSKSLKRKLLLVLTALPFWLVASTADAVLIDLNDFFADPTVSVAADGSSAFFTEDPGAFLVTLVNDPGLGDPDVIIPGAGVTLSFDFDFVEGGAGNDDEFGAFVIDAATGAIAGPAFQFFIDSTSSGTVSFDLTSLVGMTLGLQFELVALASDVAFDSTLSISDVQLIAAVPEPGTLMLLAIGLLAIFGLRASGLATT